MRGSVDAGEPAARGPRWRGVLTSVATTRRSTSGGVRRWGRCPRSGRAGTLHARMPGSFNHDSSRQYYDLEAEIRYIVSDQGAPRFPQKMASGFGREVCGAAGAMGCGVGGDEVGRGGRGRVRRREANVGAGVRPGRRRRDRPTDGRARAGDRGCWRAYNGLGFEWRHAHGTSRISGDDHAASAS